MGSAERARLYLVADVMTADEAGVDLVRAVSLALAALSTADAIVQLRGDGDAERYRELASALAGVFAPLLVTDAALSGELGVGLHLRDRGESVAQARRQSGGPVSVSTHSAASAIERARQGADYVLLGPVFDTPSKRAFGAPLGVDCVAEAAFGMADSNAQLIAIGGIERANVSQVAAVGAAGVAAIRAWLVAPDPGHAAAELLAGFDSGACPHPGRNKG